MLAITASSRAVKINTPKNKNDPTLEKGKHIILYLSIYQTNVGISIQSHILWGRIKT